MYAQDFMELEGFSHVQVLAKHKYPISSPDSGADRRDRAVLIPPFSAE